MSIKVLIVEDNDDYRDLVDFFLQSKGFEVIVARDGAEAVELSSTQKPHIILMDINMPVVDGLEATRIINRNLSTRDIPIIAVSANCSGQMGEKVLNAGAVGCVQKPVDIESLPDLILSYALNDSE
ncbi:MAG TPA: response regulator [Pyrinomonadaceae bacterium]|nr:response regulator [Pyrinomonadaceae bacterium]